MRNQSRRVQHRNADVRAGFAAHVGVGPLARECPACGAERGMKCVKWKVEKGERVCVMGTLTGFHAARKKRPGRG